jgi:mevalonate kinase
MKGPLFYAKILLFGEYGIIKNSKGLAIPYNAAKGALKIDQRPSEKAVNSNKKLAEYAIYLEQLQDRDPQKFSFDIERLNSDIAKGMYFDSSIPQGYGIGSSGALVAAIYSNYSNEKITVLENLTREKLLELKGLFGTMESFFHGTSSGLDPLNSYLSLPILIQAENEVASTAIPSQNLDGKGAVFLLDSGTVGETAPMIQIFFEKMKTEGFRSMLMNKFIKHTDACVDDFINGNFKSLFNHLKELSGVVLKNFKPMIPERFHEVWQKGIETNDYYLKLCGSGGGGYILGFTQDLEKAKKSLKGHQIEVVYTF